MENKEYYEAIFKRKSFHIFRDTDVLNEKEIEDLKTFIETVVPLHPEIKTKIRLVPQSETTCKRGAQYCILFYSETKDGYLNNIGYIGEQIDLYLAAHDIGSLWFGIGKVDEKKYEDLDYVIMIAISKMRSDKFRKDMFKSKRKELSEIWQGEELNIANIVRFTPSACNTQPWYVENKDDVLSVYRYKKPGKRGIMPAVLVSYYNRIDIGIFLFILEVCLKNEGYSFERETFSDNDDEAERSLIAKYRYEK
ncbi:MAG: nitroreductase [Erysipelotrichaceae bacterium]|nr:nitroreductase [Erysipelotrichaceae bacterium]